MASTEGSGESWSSDHSLVPEGNIEREGVEHEVESIFVLDSIGSMLSSRELSTLRGRYGIPTAFELELPMTNSRVGDPPARWIGLYEELFRADLRLPMHPFIVEIFHFFNVSFCCIIPNSFRFIVGFVVACSLAKVHPSILLFQSFFILKRYIQDW